MGTLASPAFSNTLTFTFVNNSTSLAANGNIVTYSATITGITDTSASLTQIYSFSGLNDTITYNTSTNVFAIVAGSNFSGGTQDFGATAGTVLLSWTANQSTGNSSTATYGAATTLDASNAGFLNTSFGGTPTNISDAGGITVSPSYSNNLSFSGVAATPEPASFLLFGAGLVSVAVAMRRRTAK
jgi:hypothetical protein